MLTMPPDSPPRLNGSGSHHASTPDVGSILLDRAFLMEHSLGRIESTLESHGERLDRIESQVRAVVPLSREARLRAWALGLVPKNFPEVSLASATVAGGVDLFTGVFGASDWITRTGVAIVKAAVGL
jgi:hypothetical protein